MATLKMNSLKRATICTILFATIAAQSACAFKDWGKVRLYVRPAASSSEKTAARLIQDGDRAGALKFLNSSLKSEPNNTHLLLMRAQVHEMFLDEDSAAADLSKLINLKTNPDELFTAIDICDRIDEVDVGVQLGNKFIRENGLKNPHAQLSTGRMQVKRKQYAEAEKLFLSILSTGILTDYATHDLMRLYAVWKKPLKSIERSAVAIKQHTAYGAGTLLSIRMLRGDALCDLGRYKEALNEYNICIKASETTRGAYAARARAYDGLGMKRQAAQDRQTQARIDGMDTEHFQL
jgi:tetratricopeptide (TPR) repeat protein